MTDFSLFKLRSTVFLVEFPLSVTMFMINVWQDTVPSDKNIEQLFSEEEIDKIYETREAIRNFCRNLITHIQNLRNFLIETKEAEVFKANYI